MSINATATVSQMAQPSKQSVASRPAPTVTPFSQQLDAQHGHHHHAAQSMTSSTPAAAAGTVASSSAASSLLGLLS